VEKNKVINLKEQSKLSLLADENKDLRLQILKLENLLKSSQLHLEKYIGLESDQIKKEEYYSYKDGQVNKFFAKVLAQKLININQMIYFAGENPYVFRNGVYKENKSILKDVSKYIDYQDINAVVNVKNTQKLITFDSAIDISELNPKNLVNFVNGLYDLNENVLVNHSPEIYSTFQVKAKYKPNQEIKDTMFLKFLIESGCSDDLITLIRQMIGYCLTSYTEAQKMFIIKGRPRTGKSTLLKIIRGLFERQFISTINLEDLQKGEYLAQLIGKNINVCGDIGQGYIDNVSKILQLTGDETITVRPLYANPFDASLTTKQVFATNLLPNVNDKTGAFLRRCIIIPFNNKIKEEKTISNLDKIILENEKDIIASWAIDSFKELKQNAFVFNETKETKVELDTYKKDNNSLELFVDEYCYLDREDELIYVTNSEFKNFYKIFCEVENIKMQGYKQVKEFLRNNLELQESKQSKLCQQRHYRFVSWKPEIKALVSEKNRDNNFYSGNYDIHSKIKESYNTTERKGIENE
jgi:P4 family phage/plasmid primase-like protien